MSDIWSAIDDDELNLTDKAVEFLQGEFCPPDADPMWSPEYFRWKLGPDNPAGRGYVSLAMSGDRAIGTASLTRKRLIVDGNECAGGEVGDTYSSAAMRRRGRPDSLSLNDPDPDSYVNKSIFGRLISDVRARAAADGISIIYGTPNTNSYPGYVNKLGYFDFKEYSNTSFVRPTHTLLTRKYPSLRVLNGFFQGVESFSIAVRKNIYCRVLCRGLSFDKSVPSAEELNALWSRLKPAKGFSLVRDASYWRHRYLEHPLAKYTFFGIRENGHLLGIIVVRLFSVIGGRRIVSVAEWMLDEQISFGYPLSVVLDFYKDSGVDAFNFWAGMSTNESRAATGTLFFPRRRVPVIFADTPQARSLQTMPENIQFYLGSSDNV